MTPADLGSRRAAAIRRFFLLELRGRPDEADAISYAIVRADRALDNARATRPTT